MGLSRCTCASCCLAVVSTAEEGACPPDALLCRADKEDDDVDKEAESSRFRMLRIEFTSVSRREVSVTCKTTAILKTFMGSHTAYRLLSQIRHKYHANGKNTTTIKVFKVLRDMHAYMHGNAIHTLCIIGLCFVQ